jgi:serine/threonine protein kinase
LPKNEKKKWHREKDHYYEEYYDEEDKQEEDFERNKGKYKKSNKKFKDHREVVLKSLNNSFENTDFLQETEKHKIIDDWFNNIVPCYGLSQDPETGNYLMVMQYMPEGNLRHYLSNKNQKPNP